MLILPYWSVSGSWCEILLVNELTNILYFNKIVTFIYYLNSD